ncbi:hypothetical protein KR093_003290, partial [Drosophila rubida]
AQYLCSLLCIFLTFAFPFAARNSPQDDAEVIQDPDFRDFKGVIDTGAGAHPFLQPSPSAVNFFNSFDDIFRRLRTRLWPVSLGSDESGSGDDAFDAGFPLRFGLSNLTPVDHKAGNTTSTVKVVDGHRLEINETVYGDENSHFKVRLVNVRPLESGEEVAEGITHDNGEFKPASSAPVTSAPAKHSELDDSDEDRREPLEKQTKDNEVRDIDGPQSTATTNTATTTTTAASTIAEDSIADSSENRETIMAELIEDMQQQQREEQEEQQQQQEQLAAAQDVDADTMAHNEEAETPLPDSDSDGDSDNNAAPAESIENFGSEFVDSPPHLEQLQLHREREELESSDDEEDSNHAAPIEMSDTFNDEWATLDEIADPGNDLNNHIDIEEVEKFVPVDLSNDIAVNDIAAANPHYPYNPDAELIDVNVETTGQAMMPKFEKLSLAPLHK